MSKWSPKSPYEVPKSPYEVPKSPYEVPKSPYEVLKSPYIYVIYFVTHCVTDGNEIQKDGLHYVKNETMNLKTGFGWVLQDSRKILRALANIL